MQKESKRKIKERKKMRKNEVGVEMQKRIEELKVWKKAKDKIKVIKK